MPTAEVLHKALIDLARSDSGQVVAWLTRYFGDLDIADEATQEALIEASLRWVHTGIPDAPGAWLRVVAKRKGLDLLRRRQAEHRRRDAVTAEMTFADAPIVGGIEVNIPRESLDQVDDERLRLVFLCCHPALSVDAQVALTLRLVGGLTTEEVAAAFLVPTATVAARITRAKKKIRAAAIPMSVPEHPQDRLGPVLAVLYLSFNEGYLRHSGTESPTSVDLCVEAIRLGELLVMLCPEEPEVLGLVSLMRLTHARNTARFERSEMVLLDRQDRSRWSRHEIDRGNELLYQAMKQMRPGPYQLQATIASHHSSPRSAKETNWDRVAELYDQLLAMTPSLIVSLNRAVAVAMARGPELGLLALDEAQGLDGYHLYWATRAELCHRAGYATEARVAWARALDLAVNPTEIRHLSAKLERLAT